jgi:hypothetical protein
VSGGDVGLVIAHEAKGSKLFRSGDFRCGKRWRFRICEIFHFIDLVEFAANVGG